MKIPTHCTCGGELTLHCGLYTCDWLRCRNTRCEWQTIDVGRGVRSHKDGHSEAVPT